MSLTLDLRVCNWTVVGAAPLVKQLDRQLTIFTMPRIVRRKPLLERIKSALDPMDFLLWLSEEIETRDWDSQAIGTQIGVGMNFAFLLARANSGSTKSAADSVFDEPSISGWVAFLVWRDSS